MEMTQYARPTLMSLFKALTSDTRTLIRQEVRLAKTEISEKVSCLGKNVAMVAVGGFVAYAGVIVFLIGLGWLISWGLEAAGLPVGLARFLGMGCVGTVIGVIGAIILTKALHTLAESSLAPERTIHTLQELKGPVPEGEAGASEELSSQQIQERVEATETRMSDTLEELGQRLNPSYIKGQVAERISANPYRAGVMAMVLGIASGLLLRRRLNHAHA